MVADFKIIGRATRDTELVELPNGTKKANISLATNEGEKAYYHNIIAFSDKADLCAKYILKGKQVYIEGKIKPRSYEKDGKKFYVTDFVATNVEFLGSNSNGNQEQDEIIPF